jgi:hypothetical protein
LDKGCLSWWKEGDAGIYTSETQLHSPHSSYVGQVCCSVPKIFIFLLAGYECILSALLCIWSKSDFQQLGLTSLNISGPCEKKEERRLSGFQYLIICVIISLMLSGPRLSSRD